MNKGRGPDGPPCSTGDSRVCYLEFTNKDSPASLPAAFGGDSAVRLSDGSIALTCAVSKEWQPRRPGATTRAAHPGTAVRWHDAIWEIVGADPLAAGGIRYRLSPWQEGHAIRVIEPYDTESEAGRLEIRASRAAAVRRRRLSILLAPVLGHLPGRVQKRMEWEFGAPARAMTIVSAAPFFVIGSLGLLSWLLESFGAPPLAGWLPGLPVSALLAAEAAFRVGSAVVQGEPMGSLAGVLLYEGWRRMTAAGRAGA